VRSAMRHTRARPIRTQHRLPALPLWAWSIPLVFGFLVAAFLLGRYAEAQRWHLKVPPEFVEVWIDLRAAHPDDPDKPQEVPGVSDEQIADISDEDVDLLLSDWVINVAAAAPEPRYLFELGRVALIHDQIETAYDLLEMANDAGSVPAPMYLASYFEEEDPEQARRLVESAIAMGFKPASDYWETLFGAGAVGRDPAVTAPSASVAPVGQRLW
jgi:hypothetical protein